MNHQEEEEQINRVYNASLQFIEIKGLDVFIEYLQEVEEKDIVPSSITLDQATYMNVLRRAVTDYRKKMFGK
jgi:hypothetical protein